MRDIEVHVLTTTVIPSGVVKVKEMDRSYEIDFIAVGGCLFYSAPELLDDEEKKRVVEFLKKDEWEEQKTLEKLVMPEVWG